MGKNSKRKTTNNLIQNFCNKSYNDEERLPSLEKIDESDNADTLILVCKYDWCSFNIKVHKVNGIAQNLREKQIILKRHETNCIKNHRQGKRFRQTMIDNDGRDKGRFISIEEH